MTSILNKKRDSGIEVVGDVPWGTHMCYFYYSREDLINLLISYFRAGLENNEFCAWITSEVINEKEAKEALKKSIVNFNRYVKSGQIKLFSYKELYFKNNALSLEKLPVSLIKVHDQLVDKGYDGLRIAGDVHWLKRKDLEKFLKYEASINEIIRNYSIMVICAYPINKYMKGDILNIASAHQFALFKRNSDYKIVESVENKFFEEERRHFQNQLQKLQKTENISNLTSSIAHDFNNLLTIIKGYADLAIMNIDNETGIDSYLREISKSINSAANLINQLLEFNRDRSNKLELEEVNVNEVVNKLLEMLKYFIAQNIKIEKVLDPELWKIQADPGKLEQIILNLVMNARDAMPDGGKIFIETRNLNASDLPDKKGLDGFSKNLIFFSIKDTGIGMDDNVKKHIFEPFFTTKEQGTGLGLSIIQTFVAELKGWIEVDSEPNKGSNFKVYLPASYSS